MHRILSVGPALLLVVALPLSTAPAGAASVGYTCYYVPMVQGLDGCPNALLSGDTITFVNNSPDICPGCTYNGAFSFMIHVYYPPATVPATVSPCFEGGNSWTYTAPTVSGPVIFQWWWAEDNPNNCGSQILHAEEVLMKENTALIG